MGVRVRVPAPLREFSGGRAELDILVEAGATVSRVLAGVPVGIRDRTLDEHGDLRRHMNVFLNGESVRDLEGMETKVPEGAVVHIIPAVSGGNPEEGR